MSESVDLLGSACPTEYTAHALSAEDLPVVAQLEQSTQRNRWRMNESATAVQTTQLLTDEDLPAVAELEQVTQIDPWTVEQVLAIAPLLGSGEYTGTVLRDTQDVVGYLIARLFLDECEILSVGVAPNARGNGLGQRLLQAFLSQLPEQTEQVHLEVRVSNRAAQRLYARQGFVEVGRRKAYYAVMNTDGQAGREDALLMSKYVKEIRKK